MKKNNVTIPIPMAAKGNKMMALAGKYADIWEASYISPDEFRVLNEKFKEICINEGRGDTADIVRSLELDVIIGKSESELEYKKRLFMMNRSPSIYNQIIENGLVGTPDKIKDRIMEYITLGVNQFFLAFDDPFNIPDLELFMDSINS